MDEDAGLEGALEDDGAELVAMCDGAAAEDDPENDPRWIRWFFISLRAFLRRDLNHLPLFCGTH